MEGGGTLLLLLLVGKRDAAAGVAVAVLRVPDELHRVELLGLTAAAAAGCTAAPALAKKFRSRGPEAGTAALGQTPPAHSEQSTSTPERETEQVSLSAKRWRKSQASDSRRHRWLTKMVLVCAYFARA